MIKMELIKCLRQENRKQWIEERVALLSNTFAIDVCVYNHMHSILKINAPLAHSWSDEEVIRRWQLIFAIPVLVERYFNGECYSDAEQDKALETSKHSLLNFMLLSAWSIS